MQNPNQDNSAKQFYSKADFWDERYQSGGYFDWYAEFPELQYAFETQYGMRKSDSILMVGCGNSKVSQQMYQAGYSNIVNIDISPTVIQQMKQLSPGMQWLVMDALNMTFEDGKFDYVIDKGTMDALIAGRDLTPAIDLLKQCMRVTKEEGQLIQITYGSPQGRKKIFQNALSFNTYDYYFAYVNLSDMSTMINLMRNNLIGPNGQKVQKQEALQKSMKEFLMVKLLRAKRSKDKQFIVWQNYAKSSEQIVPEKSSIVKSQELQPTKIVPEEKSKQGVKKSEAIEETQLNENIKFQSKPQKQSYVYAYSIKRKFGYDFDASSFSPALTSNLFQGSTNQQAHFQIKGSQYVKQSIAQCKQYCVKKFISHGPLDFIQAQQPFSSAPNSVKVEIEEGQNVRINILAKTNLTLDVIFTDLDQLSEAFNNLGQYLVKKMGVPIHPCPKTYSLFTVMRGRMKAKNVNQLLQKYWYPTYSFQNIDVGQRLAQVILSLPPLQAEHLAEAIKLINAYFSTLKRIKLIKQWSKNGFITFPKLNLLSTVNLFSLSYNSGKPLEVYMQDFWRDEVEHCPEQESKLFILKNTRIEVPPKIIPQAILHLMALF